MLADFFDGNWTSVKNKKEPFSTNKIRLSFVQKLGGIFVLLNFWNFHSRNGLQCKKKIFK